MFLFQFVKHIIETVIEIYGNPSDLVGRPTISLVPGDRFSHMGVLHDKGYQVGIQA